MRNILLTLTTCFVLTIAASAQMVVTLPDGSKALLRPDNTWEKIADGTAKTAASSRSMAGLIPDDPSEIVTRVMSVDVKEWAKSEFETEQQYLDRLAKIAAETRVSTAAGRTLRDCVFFVNVGNDIAKYDAETQQFDLDGIALLVRLRARGKSNVRFVERGYGRWTDRVRGLDLPAIPMPAQSAQQVKPSLTVAIFGVPVGYDAGRSDWTVNVVPTRIVVFNMNSSEIYFDRALK